MGLRDSPSCEAWYAYKRDYIEREELFKKHIEERQALQTEIKAMRERQEEERKSLFRDLSYAEGINTSKQEKLKITERQSYIDKNLELMFDDDSEAEDHNQGVKKGIKDKTFER